MYFPYLRGRQYELLALRDLVSSNLIGTHTVPIIEPVKLSPTLVNTMGDFIEKKHPLAVIFNPSVGTFLKDCNNAKECSKTEKYVQRYLEHFLDVSIIKSLIMQGNTLQIIERFEKKGINKNDLLIVNTNRDFLDMYDVAFNAHPPKYVLTPDESVFRRRVHQHKVLLDDKFEKQKRNSDYSHCDDEFFSDDHLHYKEDNFEGFSDYSVVGNEYLEAGFAPYAVAIHIVYFADDQSLRIKHFVSESNEDIRNPALKFHEALTKLYNWFRSTPQPVKCTKGLEILLEHYEKKTYPGLGTVKKLSIMHHIELMSKHLDEC